MRRWASACASSTLAITIVPSSEMSICVPVSSVSARMVAPPLPITSRIFSGLILMVSMRGQNRQLAARTVQRFLHLAQDVQAAFAGLGQRLHDFLGDALDLDVHLQGRDAVLGARDLEVHVAQVIFIAQDVGQHGELAAVQDQTHRHAGDVVLTGTPASIMASEPPQTEAIDEEPLDSVISGRADGVLEVFRGRQQRDQRAARRPWPISRRLGTPMRPVSPVANGGML